jgi:hypothetical protein
METQYYNVESKVNKWYTIEEKDASAMEDIGRLVFEEASRITYDFSYRHVQNLQNMKLYMSCDFQSTNPFNVQVRAGQNKIKVNVIQQIIDTLRAKITQNKIKPTFLTDGANWEAQERAKKLDAFCLGQFYRSKVYEQTSLSFLNGCIYGTGIVKIYPDFEKMDVCVKDINPMEILVDENEAYYGNPLTIYQVSMVDKSYLKEEYPKAMAYIERADIFRGNDWVDYTKTGDNCTVIESWRLGVGKTVGKRALSINGYCLEIEDFKAKNFPFRTWKYQDVGFSMFGRGVAELLTQLQLEVNKVFDTIQRSVHLVAVPHVLYEYGSEVIKSHINNNIGGLIGYKGTKPEWINPSPFSQELFMWLDYIINRMFQEIGVSELTSQSKAPQNLTSGEALRNYNDIETVRFATIAEKWQQFHLDIAEGVIEAAKELAKHDKGYSVLAKMNDGALDIKWKDVYLDEQSYIMQCYPSNLLPKEPAGRLATIIDMMNGGLLSPQQASQLLDFPDIEGVLRFQNSSVNDILRVIQGFLDGKYEAPNPIQDLNNGVSIMQSAYLYFKGKNLPEDKLDMFSRWIDQALFMMTPSEPETSQTIPTGQLPEEMALQNLPLGL